MIIPIFDWIGLPNQIIDWIGNRYRKPKFGSIGLDWIGNPGFEIINEMDKWWMRDINKNGDVHERIGV